jgi:hypothetical protein
MKKIFVNAAVEVRTLSPFAYRDPIKSLEKSNEARVEVDGVRVFRSAVTSGRDVKNAARALKYHLYFYATEADAKVGPAAREFLPITAAEFAEYKGNPSSVFRIATVAAETADSAAPEAVAVEAPKRKAKREKTEA